ncbi:MAG TPA: hypothetical protein ENL03_05585, partial [Phycisphaerae bacterium]|nr:hypothetical protein [Phycisphaerae bacterium]
MMQTERRAMKKYSGIVAAVLPCILLCGCGNSFSWPWSKPDMPVTRPSEVVPGEHFPTVANSDPVGHVDPDEVEVKPEGVEPGGEKDQPPVAVEPLPASRRVVAASLLQVGLEFLTADDVLLGAATQLQAIPSSLGREDFARRSASAIGDEIRTQIHQILVLAEAKKNLDEEHVEAIEKQMNVVLQDMIAATGGSRKKLESTMIQEGTTLKYELERHKKQAIVQAYLYEKLSQSITINRKMLWRYYKGHTAEFSSDLKVQIQVISSPLKRREAVTPALAREEIDLAASELAEGKDFTDVAKRLSQGPMKSSGGVWPVMASGSLKDEELESAAFALDEGQVSGVVETKFG